MKYLICSIGHTAAGKTTTLKRLSKKLGIPLISEGQIKRSFVGESFSVTDSMNEQLRDKGYKEAIVQAFNLLKSCSAVVLDASFHQLFRRLWIYDELKKCEYEIGVIWIYCYCDNINKVKERIEERALTKIITADNQARSMDVYFYTMRTFDIVSIKDFPTCFSTVIIFNNTNISSIEKVIKSSKCHIDNGFIKKVIEVING